MLDIYNYTPTIGVKDTYDKISKNNMIEIRGLRANKWDNAIVVNKYIETQNDNLIYIIQIYTRKKTYNLIDLNYFQLNYNGSNDYEKDIRYVRACNLRNIKKIYTYEQGNNKLEAITKALLKYGIINSNLLNQNKFKMTIHSKNDRLNGKKYIKLWNNDDIIGEFWFKEPNTIDYNNKLSPIWEIDLMKKI